MADSFLLVLSIDNRIQGEEDCPLTQVITIDSINHQYFFGKKRCTLTFFDESVAELLSTATNEWKRRKKKKQWSEQIALNIVTRNSMEKSDLQKNDIKHVALQPNFSFFQHP